MVDASAFMPLAIKHHVSSVPKVVIDGRHEFIGAQPIETFLDYIEKT